MVFWQKWLIAMQWTMNIFMVWFRLVKAWYVFKKIPLQLNNQMFIEFVAMNTEVFKLRVKSSLMKEK